MYGTVSPSSTSLGTLLLALALASGCGTGSGAQSPSRPLPSYAGHASELYDDTIEPAAVGLDFQKGYVAKGDPLLRERAQVSDAVLRVKVQTLTTKKDGPESTFQIGLKTVEHIAGEHAPPAEFTVRVDKTSESLGILKNFESRLVGYAFVAFVREFVRPDGDTELHFHLAPDTKDVKAAVVEALALKELK
jgi:hypothetical protein